MIYIGINLGKSVKLIEYVCSNYIDCLQIVSQEYDLDWKVYTVQWVCYTLQQSILSYGN